MKLLIVRVGAMGDVLHGLAAVAALRHAVPEIEIGWVIEPRWEPLLHSTASESSPQGPVVDRVHLAPTKLWSRSPFSRQTVQSIMALRREMRAQEYDLCIDLQGSIRSAVIGKNSQAKRFVGTDAPREKQARWLYGERYRVTSPHVVQQAAELLSAALHVDVQPVWPTPLPQDPNARLWVDHLLDADDLPVAFLAPQAGWGAKQWPAERYGAVAYALTQMGMRVLVNAVPGKDGGEDALAGQVVAASRGAAVPVACSVSQLVALLRCTRLFIGGDTGPLHMAAALGVNVVGLYGPTDPARNGPWATRSVILRSAMSVTDHRRYAQAEAGLTQIGAEEVIGAAQKCLQL